jgi:hypothetical protein
MELLVELVIVLLITFMLPLRPQQQRSGLPGMLRAHRLAPLGQEQQLVSLLALVQFSGTSRTPQGHPLRPLCSQLLALQRSLVLEELAQVLASWLVFSSQ